MHNPPWYGYNLDETTTKAIEEGNFASVILSSWGTGEMSLIAAVYVNERFDLFEALWALGATMAAEDLTSIIWYTSDADAAHVDFLLARGVPHSAATLYAALCYKKWQIVQMLLNYGVDTKTYYDPSRQISVLHTVAWAGNAVITERLLQMGAEVDNRDIDGMTPLMKICDGEYQYRIETLRIIECLLKYGADPNATAPSGETALLLCCRAHLHNKLDPLISRSEIARLLLHYGASPDVISSRGITPLMMATRYSNVAFACELLAANASIEIRTPEGTSALDIAKKWNCTEILALFAART